MRNVTPQQGARWRRNFHHCNVMPWWTCQLYASRALPKFGAVVVPRHHSPHWFRCASLKLASPGFTAGPARPVWMPRVPLRRVERSESHRQDIHALKQPKKWLIRIQALTQQHALDSSRRLPQPPNAARLGQRSLPRPVRPPGWLKRPVRPFRRHDLRAEGLIRLLTRHT